MTHLLSVAAIAIAVLSLVAVAVGGWETGRRRGSSSQAREGRDDGSDCSDELLARRVDEVVRAARTLEMVFQPIVDLRTGERIGDEALARFADGRSPEEWFVEARAVGLGVVLEVAALWRAARMYRSDGALSVNVSPATMTSDVFADFVERAAPGRDLVIELTEHVAVSDYAELCQAVGPMRERGVRVAVDDAGSGVASMRHILAVAPDIIKLDGSLIAQIDVDGPRQALAASLEQFAEQIGAELVAEGIEREEERAVCERLGITWGQGYLFGVPGPQTGDELCKS